MKIKLLIATADSDYAEHLSNTLSEKYIDTYEVSVCSSVERLREVLVANRFEIALLDPGCASFINIKSIRLPLVLLDESGSVADSDNGIKKIRKYQRISSISGNILENYSEISKNIGSLNLSKARITAVWSPSGGSGKTTVALAFAAYKVSSGKETTYLNLENFSSTPVYFQENGRSISKVFENFESDIHMLLKGIRLKDDGSGISYFCRPENYDDINILTVNDIETLVKACTDGIDEVVIDLSSQCDERVQKILELADTVFLVADPSNSSQVKLKQFISQHNTFGKIQSKTVLINNKGEKKTDVNIKRSIRLPQVQSTDPVSVFKSLSSSNLDW